MSDGSSFRIRNIDNDWMEIEFHHKVNVRRHDPMSGFKQHLQRMLLDFDKDLTRNIISVKGLVT